MSDLASASDSSSAPRLVVVDAANCLYRAFFAIPPLRAADGTPTNAAYGFLNMLLKLVPPRERIITLEDVRELRPTQPNNVVLLASKGDQGEAQVTIQDLLEATLRMRPDRIFVGELRSKEAFTFLRAVNTGHPGSITTVHADTPTGAYQQLVMMGLQADLGIKAADIEAYVRSVIPIVVQLQRTETARFVSEIHYAKMPAASARARRAA